MGTILEIYEKFLIGNQEEMRNIGWISRKVADLKRVKALRVSLPYFEMRRAIRKAAVAASPPISAV